MSEANQGNSAELDFCGNSRMKFSQSPVEHTCGCLVTLRRRRAGFHDRQMFNSTSQTPKSPPRPRQLIFTRGCQRAEWSVQTLRRRHFYFCTDITSERGTDVALSCCSERQNKASTETGNNKRDQTPRLCFRQECVCVCVLEAICPGLSRPSQEESFHHTQNLTDVSEGRRRLIVDFFFSSLHELRFALRERYIMTSSSGVVICGERGSGGAQR